MEGTGEKTIREKYIEFLESKYSENTKQYIFAIIEYLGKTRDDGSPLPIKAKELQTMLVPDKIPYLGVFYRLLKELGTDEGIGIIEKNAYPREKGQRGKNPIYYSLTIPKDELIKQVSIGGTIELTSEASSCFRFKEFLIIIHHYPH